MAWDHNYAKLILACGQLKKGIQIVSPGAVTTRADKQATIRKKI